MMSPGIRRLVAGAAMATGLFASAGTTARPHRVVRPISSSSAAVAPESRPARFDAAQRARNRASHAPLTWCAISSFEIAQADAPKTPEAVLASAATRRGFALRPEHYDSIAMELEVETDRGSTRMAINWTSGRGEWRVHVGNGGFCSSLDVEVMEALRVNLKDAGIPSRLGDFDRFATGELYHDETLGNAIRLACEEHGWTLGEPDPGQDCCFFAVLGPAGQSLGRISVYLWGVVEVALGGDAAGQETAFLTSVLDDWAPTPASEDGSGIQVEYETGPPAHLVPQRRPVSR
jgi:hypothetical protein